MAGLYICPLLARCCEGATGHTYAKVWIYNKGDLGKYADFELIVDKGSFTTGFVILSSTKRMKKEER